MGNRRRMHRKQVAKATLRGVKVSERESVPEFVVFELPDQDIREYFGGIYHKAATLEYSYGTHRFGWTTERCEDAKFYCYERIIFKNGKETTKRSIRFSSRTRAKEKAHEWMMKYIKICKENRK